MHSPLLAPAVHGGCSPQKAANETVPVATSALASTPSPARQAPPHRGLRMKMMATMCINKTRLRCHLLQQPSELRSLLGDPDFTWQIGAVLLPCWAVTPTGIHRLPASHPRTAAQGRCEGPAGTSWVCNHHFVPQGTTLLQPFPLPVPGHTWPPPGSDPCSAGLATSSICSTLLPGTRPKSPAGAKSLLLMVRQAFCEKCCFSGKCQVIC